MVKIHFLRSQIIENDVEASFPNVVLMLFALNGYTSTTIAANDRNAVLCIINFAKTI